MVTQTTRENPLYTRYWCFRELWNHVKGRERQQLEETMEMMRAQMPHCEACGRAMTGDVVHVPKVKKLLASSNTWNITTEETLDYVTYCPKCARAGGHY